MAENPQLLSRGFMKEEQKPFYKSRVGYLLISLFVFAALILLVRRFAVSNKDNNNTNAQVGNDNVQTQQLVEPKTYMEVLSWSPRIFKFKNFLTPEECDQIIEKAKDRLRLSSLYSGKGSFNDANTRSSQDMFFNADETKWLDERISRATRIPASHGESLTVIHYGPNQQYLPHFDYFAYGQDDNTDNLLNTYGNRIATFIMYLNDLDEDAGGTTKFPDAAGGPVAVRPKKGDATFFYNMLPSGLVDPMSLHTGSPVLKGEKWIATKWIREKKWKQEDDYVPTFGTAAKDIVNTNQN